MVTTRNDANFSEPSAIHSEFPIVYREKTGWRNEVFDAVSGSAVVLLFAPLR